MKKLLIILLLFSAATSFSQISKFGRGKPGAPGTPGIPPIAPTLSLPPNSSLAVSTTPTLDWSNVSGATSYGVLVDNNSDFSSPVIDVSGLSVSVYSVTSGLVASTTYYWKASSSNAFGTSSYSSAFSFTTSADPPSAPTLLSPGNTEDSVSVAPTLDWSNVATATSYSVILANNIDFSNAHKIIDTAGLSTSQYVFGTALSLNTTYYWKAKATNSFGASSYSSVFSFTTTPVGALTLIEPANHSPDVDANGDILFDWSDAGTLYDLQVASDNGFSSLYIDETGLVNSDHTSSGILSPDTQYFWRVRADGGAWSTTFDFTTIP